MIKSILGVSLLLISSCSTFKKEIVKCPPITSPNGSQEIIAKSENGIPTYMGLRDVEFTCYSNRADIDMTVFVNIRSIRNNSDLSEKATACTTKSISPTNSSKI